MDGILILDERWQIYEEVGSGTYGSVYLGINTTNNQKTAIKKMRTCLSDDGIPIDTLREIILLKSISHENIIK